MDAMRHFQQLIDWLTPESVRHDVHASKRIRMFLISHLFGPVLSHPITIYLLMNDPNPWPHVHIIGASITAFWVFPFLVRVFDKHYNTLALLSVANLNFAILWGSYNYGGTSSPFLVWFAVLPLLGFFYLGSGIVTRVAIFAQMVFGMAGFYALYLYMGMFPVHIPLSGMVTVGVISTFSASVYVFMMASYYSNVVDSQSGLLQEIERHRETMAKLTKAKEEAERANGAKSDFLAKMSHELRTPLNAVLGYSEILLEDAELEGNGGQIADLQKISAAGKHLLAMVNDILDISKIEAGKMELNIERFDLRRFIAEIETTSRPLAAKNTNSFAVEYDCEIETVETDATKLRQAIFNLLSNAAKFTQNGQISLIVRGISKGGRDWVTIAVADTGIGISEEQRVQLFKNFAQADPTVAAKFGGTGLGLSLSRNLCRLMGGDITVDSTPGKGSCFTVILPAKPGSAERPVGQIEVEDDAAVLEAEMEHEARIDAYAGMGAGGETPNRGRILLVDDDFEFLELTERLLRKEGFSPIATSTPESVLQIARSSKPMAIFMDILMPGLNGWEVLDALKSDPVTASIPVVMISVMEDRTNALRHGAAGIVMKPFDNAKLKQALAIADQAGKALRSPSAALLAKAG